MVLKHQKILLIDDNKELTRLLARYLEMKNYDITVSNDGKNGTSLILDQKFDIILLDISMPGVSGFDVIGTLVKQGRINDQKIIVLTAVHLSTDEVRGLLEVGAHSCLFKPVNMDLLLATIESRKGGA